MEIEDSMAANDNDLEVLREELKSKELLIGQLNMQLHDSRGVIASHQQRMNAFAVVGGDCGWCGVVGSVLGFVVFGVV